MRVFAAAPFQVHTAVPICMYKLVPRFPKEILTQYQGSLSFECAFHGNIQNYMHIETFAHFSNNLGTRDFSPRPIAGISHRSSCLMQ